MVNDRQFQDALNQINQEFLRLKRRIEKLEKPNPKGRPKKEEIKNVS
jgi:hypothetical protein